jgi:hypothetical protein
MRRAAIVLPAALLLVAFPPRALPAAPTRSEYVTAAEPVCKAETLAHQGVLRGVEEMVEEGRLRPAAARLRRAGAALRAAVERLAVLPRPPADRARLARWFGYAGGGSRLLGKMATALDGGDRRRAQRLAAVLIGETKRANATVVGFGFDYCRLNPARFD